MDGGEGLQSSAEISVSFHEHKDGMIQLPRPPTIVTPSLPYLINVEHIQVNLAQLVHVGMSEGFAGSNVGLQDVAELLDGL